MLDVVSTVPDERDLSEFESSLWRMRGTGVIVPNPTISKIMTMPASTDVYLCVFLWLDVERQL